MLRKSTSSKGRRVSTRKPRGHGVGVRFTPEVREALDRAAGEQRRSLSNLIEVATAEWLEREGYLKK
jgi:predicted HicB family RNase H-like nuclease